MNYRIRSVAGVRHRRGGGASLADRARSRGVGSLFRLDQHSRLSGGFYGVGVGGGHFHRCWPWASLWRTNFLATPSRTAPVGLGARIVTGALTGACLAVAGDASLWLGALAGAVGGIAGAFAGYRARVGLVRALHVPDFAIAIPEDLIAIGLGLFLVSRF